MGGNSKFSKEVKIQACKDYEEGNLSFACLSKIR
jgi:transposase-like protein